MKPTPLTKSPGYDFKYWVLFSGMGGNHWYDEPEQFEQLKQGIVFGSREERDEAEKYITNILLS
jgi:hypothetical protein